MSGPAPLLPDRKDSPVVRLAVPNKGRIAAPIMELMEKSGLHLLDSGERRLISRTPDPHIEVLFARPIDIPEYVANGAADLGITGRDMVSERGSDVEELLDLQMGSARLVLAVSEESRFSTPKDLAGARVATEFPAITREYFRKLGIKVTIVPVGGACEATPYLGIADAIVDLVSSGTTLRQNHLVPIDTGTREFHYPYRKYTGPGREKGEDRRDRPRTRECAPGRRAVLPDDERGPVPPRRSKIGIPGAFRANRDGSRIEGRPGGRTRRGERRPCVPADKPA